jgi:hypothetical protein
MNVSLLIDAVVRQTMILVAQLSTTAGVRAPLEHVANRVFLDLVTELEHQGVGRKVIADMFGLALRSYQQKVQRLTESATERGASIWEAVYDFVQREERVTRARVLQRFARDDGAIVRSILSDLVSSGLVYKTGRGDATVYRIASAEDLKHAFDEKDKAAEAALIWLTVYREGPLDRRALAERLRIDDVVLDDALTRLVSEGRVQRSDATPSVFSAESVLLPLGDPAGWEAAFVDHYRAMVGALCAKLASMGAAPGEDAARIGGSTFSFDVWPGHPQAARVLSVLERFRTEIGALWDEVHGHNVTAERPEEYRKVTFYFGQNVRIEGPEQES